jgi:ribonuclease HII
MRSIPDFTIEEKCGGLVCGVDEVGRGALCGPVVAAAVIVDRSDCPDGINDSKLLSRGKRERLYKELMRSASVGVGSAKAGEVDRLNVLNATLLAMERAVSNLCLMPEMVLVDGNKVPNLLCATRSVVGGDRISISIASASIVAKVTRDRLMAKLSLQHPAYGWEANAGYGTPQHIEAIRTKGITRHHRRGFGPVAKALAKRD